MRSETERQVAAHVFAVEVHVGRALELLRVAIGGGVPNVDH